MLLEKKQKNLKKKINKNKKYKEVGNNMTEKVGKFFTDYGGFILGLIIGLVVVLLGVIEIITKIAIVIGFGLIGAYIQKNKGKVKERLKNQIDKW